MRKRIITVLMVMIVVLSGCGNYGQQSKIEDKTTNVVEKTVTSADANSGKNKELVMYKKKDIIDKIKDAHVGIGLYMAMSRVVTIEDFKKILPVDNLREVGKDKLVIKYPMEDRTFIVVAVKNDERIMGTCVMRNVLRNESEVSQIKKGMSLKKVRRIFPEVIINTRRPLILDKSRGIDEFPACEVILDNNKMAWITFEKNNGKYVVSDINIQKNPIFEDKEWEKVIQQEPNIKGANAQRETFYELSKSSISKYKYLIERSGKMPNAKCTEHGFYLVNDKSVTYRQLMWSRLSGNSNDWIDFRTVFTEMTES